jgi:class 3 adenylate cyclase
MRSGIRRFGEEFFLYSSQFVAFFIFILFIVPDSGSLGIVSAGLLGMFIIMQTILLAGSGHKALLRFLFSLITPFGYSLIQGVAGGFSILDMANVFLWGTAIYSGFFQTAALSATDSRIRRTAEGLLALGSAIIFVFFYYYLNLKLGIEAAFRNGDMDRAACDLALDIRAFPSSFLVFMKNPQHWFPAFGALTFAFMLLSSKLHIISLHTRIERLFGSATCGESETAAVEDAGLSDSTAKARRRPVTIISSDILGFTDISEKLGPEGGAQLLNRYYSLWHLEASRREGKIFSLTGDSVILVFGLDMDSVGAEAALASALAFLGEISGLRSDLTASGLPATFDVSVGIHTGTIVEGMLGPGADRKPGVFGDAIAVAARLDSLCRELKQELIVSQTTFSRLGLESQASLESIGEVLLRKSTHPVPVYGKKQKHD